MNPTSPCNLTPTSPRSQAEALLRVENLKVMVNAVNGHQTCLIDRANLTLNYGDSLGLVGESGSGKSMLCRALIGTLGRYGAGVTEGAIRFEGRDLTAATERTWRKVRGRRIGYIPQSSMAGLNPVLTVGTQMLEAVAADTRLRGAQAKARVVHYLDLVQLPRVGQLLSKRAHELSGGMRQRVMIAAALARRPELLVADEPTTALDVSVQSEILSMLRELRAELGMSLILVSHDIAVIEEVCDRVLVMYAGATVEEGSVASMVTAPLHPYTEALLSSRIDSATPGQDVPAIAGEPPMAGAWPVGCRFWPRCPEAGQECRSGAQPGLAAFPSGSSACLHTGRRLQLEII